MPIKIISLLFACLLLIGKKAQAQETPQQRYDRYIREAAKCLQDSNLTCANDKCDLALRMERSYTLSPKTAGALMREIKNRKTAQVSKSQEAAHIAEPLNKLPSPNVPQIATMRSNTAFVKMQGLKRSLTFPATYLAEAKGFSKEKILADSKNFLVFANSAAGASAEGTDPFIESYEDRLYGINYLKEDQWLYDSTLRIINRNRVISDEVFYIHLQAALYHAWNLEMQRRWNRSAENSVFSVVQNTINIISRDQRTSHRAYFAYSGFENLLSYYYDEMNNKRDSYRHALAAVRYSVKAAEMQPRNSYYLRSLFIYLNNLKRIPDSILTDADKKNFEEIECNLAAYMNSGIPVKKQASLFAEKECAISSVNNLLNSPTKQNCRQAISILKDHIESVRMNRERTDYKDYGPLLLCVYYNKLGYIYHFYYKDSLLYRKNILNSYEALLDFLDSKITSQRALELLQEQFDDLALNLDVAGETNEIIDRYKKIVDVIESRDNDYVALKDLSYVYTTSSTYVGSESMKMRTRRDSAEALTYFLKAITIFKNTEMLKYYSSYSEDYGKFCSIFGKVIELYVRQNNYVMARETYEYMMNTFKPFYKKYGFDFYFVQHLISGSRSYGNFLFSRNRYKEAIAPLQFASFEGVKKSSDLLVEIYSMPETRNAALADSFRKISSYQSDGMKTFNVPVTCGSLNEKVDVYTLDRAKGHPYKGIEDQARYFKEARGCEIPKDIVTAFTKLQKLAWENDVSFQDLCAYALHAASDEEGRDKYDSLRTEIKETRSPDRQVALYEKMLAMYDKDIAENTEDKDNLLAAEIRACNDYLGLLIDLNELAKASKIRDKALRLSFVRNKNDLSKLTKTNSLYALQQYIVYYHEEGNVADARAVRQHLINVYKDTIRAQEQLLKTKHPADSMSIRENISSQYNSCGWNLLLLQKFDEAMVCFRKSYKLDDTNKYAMTNIPHALLFTGQFEQAKAMYLQLKDQPFDADAGYPTFKDAFLSDFKDFENEGIDNADIKKIIALLK